jgi:hypothetical protein
MRFKSAAQRKAVMAKYRATIYNPDGKPFEINYFKTKKSTNNYVRSFERQLGCRLSEVKNIREAEYNGGGYSIKKVYRILPNHFGG